MVRSLEANEEMSKASRSTSPDGMSIVNIRDVPSHLLARHDKKYTGSERPRLWSTEHMLDRKDASGVVLVSKNPPSTLEELHGWCLIRRCSGGLRLGPPYADHALSAKLVLVSAMKSASPRLVKDISLPKEAISELSEAEIAQASVW